MATLGLTKLEILNQIAEAIGLPPATALPSTGGDTTSVYARAEDTMDRVARRVLGRGWPCNTIYGKSYTAADIGGGVYTITLASTVLAVRCVAPGRYAGKLSLSGDTVYLQETGSTDFGSAVNVYLDVINDIADIATASPDVKELIAAEAAKEFQRRRKGSQTQDAFLSEEHARADIGAGRLNPSQPQPWNPAPLIAPSRSGERSER